MFITADSRKIEFIGKVAAIGQGGSGKTFMINNIANYIAEKDIYNWHEEANMAGTIAVTPYSIEFPDKKKKIIINDNPGQDSLELIRKIIASQGDVYQGIIVVVDSLAWNFRNIGLMQAKTLTELNKNKTLPMTVIISKRDLRDYLVQSRKITELSHLIASIVNKLPSNELVIRFKDRAYNKKGVFKTNLSENGLIPLTILEQVLVNGIDSWLAEDPIQGFTKMNVRLLVRSFLLGYCEAMKNTLDLSLYPIFTSLGDPNLVNRLNYHRPTAFETGTGWEKLAGKNKDGKISIEEPPMIKSTFDPKTIEIILMNYVLASENKILAFVEEIKSLATINNWNLINYCYTNSVEKTGKENIKNTILQLINAIEEQTRTKKPKKEEQTVSKLGLDEF